MKLDYKKMVKEIDDLVETDFCFEMDNKQMPNSCPYTIDDAKKMAKILGKIYMISHCIDCSACQGKYIKK